MYGVKLDHAELWIAVENDVPQLVYVTYEELKGWLTNFLKLVKGYHDRYDYLLTPITSVEPKTVINRFADLNNLPVKQLCDW